MARTPAAAKHSLKRESNFLGTFPFPSWLVSLGVASCSLLLLVFSIYLAYRIRLFSVEQYGYLIHEFDPWFNFRATQYLSDHGWHAFFHWFDYESWYPLGRPVGTTIYPGLQITAVALHRVLAAVGLPVSLNNVCVLIPAWFGSFATVLVALLALEAGNSLPAAAIASYTFSIVPAHTMRSMAGEFDNECIALSAMLLTFYCWVRSLRGPRSWPIGVLAGLAYGNMVAAWGGYIFVLNMVALHAAVCALVDWGRNTYNPGLLRAYTLFFVIGTAIATRVPPVGLAPFKSLEQLSALIVFIFLCILHVSEGPRRRAGVPVLSQKCLRIRCRLLSLTVGGLLLFASFLAPPGYFGPLSVRVRALFLPHTHTGNPLVDSVAEHQPASSGAYWQFLHVCSLGWMCGVGLLIWKTLSSCSPSKTFTLLYSFVAYYFSHRMSRLLILSGPVACITTGLLAGWTLERAVHALFWNGEEAIVSHKKTDGRGKPAGGLMKAKRTGPRVILSFEAFCRSHPLITNTVLYTASLCCILAVFFSGYSQHCEMFAHSAGGPQIVFKAQIQGPDGSMKSIIVDDYLQSYLWLKDSTPQDARVLSWWDYGYQITGIGNRTTLADGNTWNHEHIATVGKILTSPVAEAHSLARHLADYVLVWTGRNGADLMKSPHMARIGNSVYADICPRDPLCEHFGFYTADFSRPTPSMRKSLLYHLHGADVIPGVSVSPNLFQEVYRSKYGLVRIFKVMNVSEESKAWIADPANRVCRPPDSWVCPGQYPPAPEIQLMLAKRRDFGK